MLFPLKYEIRMTPDQKQSLKHQAGEMGYESISQYVRAIADGRLKVGR